MCMAAPMQTVKAKSIKHTYFPLKNTIISVSLLCWCHKLNVYSFKSSCTFSKHIYLQNPVLRTLRWKKEVQAKNSSRVFSIQYIHFFPISKTLYSCTKVLPFYIFYDTVKISQLFDWQLFEKKYAFVHMSGKLKGAKKKIAKRLIL